MFYGLNKFIKNFLPKRLFYRSLIIVAAPIILLQITITIVFFDSIWIKANKGMTGKLVVQRSRPLTKDMTDHYLSKAQQHFKSKVNKDLKILS